MINNDNSNNNSSFQVYHVQAYLFGLINLNVVIQDKKWSSYDDQTAHLKN